MHISEKLSSDHQSEYGKSLNFNNSATNQDKASQDIETANAIGGKIGGVIKRYVKVEQEGNSYIYYTEDRDNPFYVDIEGTETPRASLVGDSNVKTIDLPVSIGRMAITHPEIVALMYTASRLAQNNQKNKGSGSNAGISTAAVAAQLLEVANGSEDVLAHIADLCISRINLETAQGRDCSLGQAIAKWRKGGHNDFSELAVACNRYLPEAAISSRGNSKWALYSGEKFVSNDAYQIHADGLRKVGVRNSGATTQAIMLATNGQNGLATEIAGNMIDKPEYVKNVQRVSRMALFDTKPAVNLVVDACVKESAKLLKRGLTTGRSQAEAIAYYMAKYIVHDEDSYTAIVGSILADSVANNVHEAKLNRAVTDSHGSVLHGDDVQNLHSQPSSVRQHSDDPKAFYSVRREFSMYTYLHDVVAAKSHFMEEGGTSGYNETGFVEWLKARCESLGIEQDKTNRPTTFIETNDTPEEAVKKTVLAYLCHPVTTSVKKYRKDGLKIGVDKDLSGREERRSKMTEADRDMEDAEFAKESSVNAVDEAAKSKKNIMDITSKTSAVFTNIAKQNMEVLRDGMKLAVKVLNSSNVPDDLSAAVAPAAVDNFMLITGNILGAVSSSPGSSQEDRAKAEVAENMYGLASAVRRSVNTMVYRHKRFDESKKVGIIEFTKMFKG
jgi:hypothetical protein